MTVYSKLSKAKKQIAETKMEKAGKNSFSNYTYFTPEQVAQLVQKACEDNGLITLFSLKRNEHGEYGVLSIIDIDEGGEIVVEGATAIPEIKATNVVQQIGGCMTYTERYLKMSAFGIIDNNLDFDTTENTKKNAGLNKFTDAIFKKFIERKDNYKTGDEAVNKLKESYILDSVFEAKVRALYGNNK